MNRAEELAFAWALVDSARRFLDKSSRTWLCVKIGAGELEVAIRGLLEGFVSTDTALPASLSVPLWAWLDGFVGSDSEPDLRELACRIRLSGSDRTEPEPSAKYLVARRDAAVRSIDAEQPRVPSAS